MNPGGDAAEQVVRLSLEGAEVAARITGNGAKNIALLLYATLKQEQKTKGRARLTSMLKSGKELKVYTITQKDLKRFSQEAKRYGVLYCVLKDKTNTDPDAAIDVIARAEDASKIQRITERFKLMTVDKAEVALDIQRAKSEREPKEKSVRTELRDNHSDDEKSGAADPELHMPSIDDAEITGGRALEMNGGREDPPNPSLMRTEGRHLSAGSSRQAGRSNGSEWTEKPSVREKLGVYRAQADAAREEMIQRELGKRRDRAADALKKINEAKDMGRGR